IGITPHLSIASVLKRTGHPDVTVHLVTRDQAPLQSLLAPLQDAGCIVLHRTAATGRPDLRKLLGPPQPDTVIGCCGPDTMISDFEQAAADWPGDNVHIERFVAPPPPPLDP